MCIFSSQGVHLNPLKCMCSRPCKSVVFVALLENKMTR